MSITSAFVLSRSLNSDSRHLRAHDIEAEEGVTCYGAEGSGPSIHCFDPNGNQIELKGPAESAAG